MPVCGTCSAKKIAEHDDRDHRDPDPQQQRVAPLAVGLLLAGPRCCGPRPPRCRGSRRSRSSRRRRRSPRAPGSSGTAGAYSLEQREQDGALGQLVARGWPTADRATSAYGMPTIAVPAAPMKQARCAVSGASRREDPLHEVDGDDVADAERDERRPVDRGARRGSVSCRGRTGPCPPATSNPYVVPPRSPGDRADRP